ncbi:uncharacterized protein LOC129606985 [Condylostylus longicornis]|uniref:uncharacterized protein LOC129606985 n=1 Tax=Condylostylus longicornis TaxID=2530218 RepID=UPI00244E20B1|nr:uncharacterized protein LOC129606985 [Condylostylus longicornis]XP_055373628.1 uncharacterized protein LOC129606985 [Condylostylus longicornis]
MAKLNLILKRNIKNKQKNIYNIETDKIKKCPWKSSVINFRKEKEEEKFSFKENLQQQQKKYQYYLINNIKSKENIIKNITNIRKIKLKENIKCILEKIISSTSLISNILKIPENIEKQTIKAATTATAVTSIATTTKTTTTTTTLTNLNLINRLKVTYSQIFILIILIISQLTGRTGCSGDPTDFQKNNNNEIKYTCRFYGEDAET